MGMAWREWEGSTTMHFPIFHPEQGDMPTHAIERKTGTGENWPHLDICILIWFSVVFDTKRLPFIVSLLVICFTISMKNSNRYDEILVWDWQREGMGMTDGTGKGIAIKPRWTWQREWEWRVGNGRGGIEKNIPLISSSRNLRRKFTRKDFTGHWWISATTAWTVSLVELRWECVFGENVCRPLCLSQAKFLKNVHVTWTCTFLDILRTPVGARSYHASAFLLDWLCVFVKLINSFIHSLTAV